MLVFNVFLLFDTFARVGLFVSSHPGPIVGSIGIGTGHSLVSRKKQEPVISDVACCSNPNGVCLWLPK